MVNPLVRRGRNTYDVYSVFYNSDFNGCATRVRLGSRDRWVGSDYWRYVETIQLSPFDRALRVMGRLERQHRTQSWAYRRAQQLALKLLLAKR